MKKISALLILGIVVFFQISCGVKSRPLPPLKDPWISTGDFEKDREKKNKTKKQPSTDNRVEFEAPPAAGQKKEF